MTSNETSFDYARTPRLALNRWITIATILICCAIYLPTLGLYGMFDPWETHYTEVARQFMERDDWLSTHWHNGTGPEGTAENRFWTKPVGSFWLSGLSLKIFGLDDRITVEAAKAQGLDAGRYLTDHPVEWVVRLPFFLSGLFGIVCAFLFMARVFGTRAGILSALIIATAPMYFLITRQAMTDMPYVGFMSGALCLLAMALFVEPRPFTQFKHVRLRGRLIRWPHCGGFYSVLAVFTVMFGLQIYAILPPLLGQGVGIHIGPISLSKAIWLIPYGALFVFFLALATTRTRTQNDLYLYGFYLAVACAGLAKGLIGALQPGLVILVYLICSGEWSTLRHVALGRGLLIISCTLLPWYHAMLVTYGVGWWNELFGTEQLRRLTIGEQQHAKGSFEYYVAQLGLGLYPWSALLPAALVQAWRLRIGPARERSGDQRARLFVYVWLVVPWALFTAASTKYHHYILPAVVPGALAVALFLDDLIAGRLRRPVLSLAASIIMLAALTIDLYLQPAHYVWMFTYLYTANWAKGVPAGLPFLCLGAACVIAALPLFWARTRRWGLIAFTAASVLGGSVLLNWYQLRVAPHWTQKHILQTYYKKRAGPEEELVAWQFNWRGETWYTAAQVVVAKSTENKAIQDWLKERAGKRFFFVTERHRYNSLRSMMPTENGRKTLKIVDDSSVHFILAAATI